MENYSHYNAILKNSKKQEKWVHDLANHFSTLNYLTRNQHFTEVNQYIEQLIPDLLTQEDCEQFKHYKKHILYQLYKLKTLIPTHPTEDMLIHIKHMSQQLDTLAPEIYCDHALLNAVLCQKRRIAIEHHIDIHYTINFPIKVSMPDPQLLSIFFNLLDNAIEACDHSHVQHPFIQLKINHKGNMLSIQMLNSKNPKIPFTRKTTKEDNHLHGFGLQIIEETIKGRLGYTKWTDCGNVFESILMFQISD